MAAASKNIKNKQKPQSSKKVSRPKAFLFEWETCMYINLLATKNCLGFFYASKNIFDW